MADYDERVLLVEVAGIRQQGVVQTSHSTFKVPYGSLSRSLQLIKLKGGRIVRIHPLASSLMRETVESPLPKTAEAPLPKIAEAPLPKIAEAPLPKIAEAPSPLPGESGVSKQPKPRLPGLLRRLLGNT